MPQIITYIIKGFYISIISIVFNFSVYSCCIVCITEAFLVLNRRPEVSSNLCSHFLWSNRIRNDQVLYNMQVILLLVYYIRLGNAAYTCSRTFIVRKLQKSYRIFLFNYFFIQTIKRKYTKVVVTSSIGCFLAGDGRYLHTHSMLSLNSVCRLSFPRGLVRNRNAGPIIISWSILHGRFFFSPRRLGKNVSKSDPRERAQRTCHVCRV